MTAEHERSTTQKSASQAYGADSIKVLEGLETRLTQLHDEADRFVLSKHWGLAREKYERILEAVPSAQEPIQRFAAERYARLAKVATR